MLTNKSKKVVVKDNSVIEATAFDNVPNILDIIESKTVTSLLEEGLFVFPPHQSDIEDLSIEQMILYKENNNYRTSNMMGYIGVGEEQLLIQSRFSEGEEDYLFRYMLEKVFNIPNIIDLSITGITNNKGLDLLMFTFPYFLKKALRKGLYKAYVTKEFNDNNFKGQVDVIRNIANNNPFVGKIAYNQREFSFDNNITQLIRHTIEFVESKSQGKVLSSMMQDEIMKVKEATTSYSRHNRTQIIEVNSKKKISHAYYHEYRELQEVCLKILNNEKIVVEDSKRKVYGVVFDGAWLWEEYVNSLIGDDFYHPDNTTKKGRQTLFNHNRGHIYPDFISKDSINRVIVDAKYKPSRNIGNRDYLQILAYMFRFDSKSGIYVFPKSNIDNNIELTISSGLTFEKNVNIKEGYYVRKLGLTIPKDSRNYDEYKNSMESNEMELKSSI